jgi:ribonuclease HII
LFAERTTTFRQLLVPDPNEPEAPDLAGSPRNNEALRDQGKLLVGIDEAGYGPNLGPLVVTAVWATVPAESRSDSLWDMLRPAVSRWPGNGDSLVVDDSKRVYSADGVGHLERLALAWMGTAGGVPQTLGDLWRRHSLTPSADFAEAACVADGDVGLPWVNVPESIARDVSLLRRALHQAQVECVGAACQIILPRRFNDLLQKEDSKSTALFRVNAELLRHIWQTSKATRVEVTADKHGGRNFYGALLQQTFAETLVLAGREGAAASEYTVSAGARRLQARFVPRADADHLLVAAASMISKYIRELWMGLFNRFWTREVPGLDATAGYPVDARRFWNEIEPAASRLRVPRQLIWRDK